MVQKINLERLLIVAAIVLGVVAIVYMFSGKRNQVTENPNTLSDSLRMELVKAKLAAQEAEVKTRQTNVIPPMTEEERKEKLRKELMKMEMENPLEYVSIDYNHTYRWLAAKEEYSGYIYNNATLATFMNFVVRVTFLSKTRTAIDTKTFTVYEYCEPNSRVAFKIQTEAPSGYAYHQVEVIRANYYQEEEE
ncbi:MAG: hypothetical protein RLZZ531_2133 [Bacteroidota bacterium]|jgi:uncharacterized membrane protein YcgQ (UPF0703/DUF1980 family)